MPRDFLAALGAMFCGFAWGHAGMPAFGVLAAAVPFLWGVSSTRWYSGAVVLAYYLAASRGLPHGAGVFFADMAPAWFGWVLWLAAGAINAAVWTAAWHAEKRRRAVGAVLAILVTTIPPVGVIGWVSPLTSAGWLFPGLGFIGLVFLAALSAAMAARTWAVIGMLAGAAAVANICAAAWPKAPPSQLAQWSAQNTQFQRLQSGSLEHLNSRLQLVMERAEQLQAGQVVVLPETLLPAASPSVSFAWLMLDDIAEKLEAKGALMLVGTELAKPGQAMENILLPLGEHNAKPLTQRVPVPVGMWRPWDKITFKADLLGSGVAQLHGQKVAYLICYEQLLVFPVLVSMTQRPDMLIGAANLWWAKETSIPVIQSQSLIAWGLLFGVPVIQATNA